MYIIRRIIAVPRESSQLSIELLGLVATWVSIYYRSKAIIELT